MSMRSGLGVALRMLMVAQVPAQPLTLKFVSCLLSKVGHDGVIETLPFVATGSWPSSDRSLTFPHTAEPGARIHCRGCFPGFTTTLSRTPPPQSTHSISSRLHNVSNSFLCHQSIIASKRRWASGMLSPSHRTSDDGPGGDHGCRMPNHSSIRILPLTLNSQTPYGALLSFCRSPTEGGVCFLLGCRVAVKVK